MYFNLKTYSVKLCVFSAQLCVTAVAQSHTKAKQDR